MIRLLDNRKFLIFAALFFGVTVHCYHLTISSHPSGWDGYYYVMQLQSIFENGHMQSSDYSIIYLLLSLVALFTTNYILAFKVTLFLLVVAFILVVIHLFRNKGQHVFYILLLALIFSPSLTYLAAQYPKNLLGLIFLLLFLKNYTARNMVGITVFFIATFLTHRLTGGVALIALPFLIFSLNKRLAIIIALGSFVVMGLGVTLFPGILHVTDLLRFEGEFSYWPNFAPISFLKSWGWNLMGWWWFEIFLHTICLLILIYHGLRSKWMFKISDVRSVFIWVTLLLWFPFLKVETGSMGYRFYLLSLVLTPVLIAYTIETLNMRLPSFIVAICIVISLLSFNSYSPLIFEPNWNRLKSIAIKAIKSLKIHQPQLIVAHQGLAELIIIYSSFEALNWSPDLRLDRSKIYRLAVGIEFYDLTKHLSKKELIYVERIDVNYFVIREDVWNKWLALVLKSGDMELIKRVNNPLNPMRELPIFLKK